MSVALVDSSAAAVAAVAACAEGLVASPDPAWVGEPRPEFGDVVPPAAPGVVAATGVGTSRTGRATCVAGDSVLSQDESLGSIAAILLAKALQKKELQRKNTRRQAKHEHTANTGTSLL